MTTRHISLVQESFAALAPMADVFARRFYDRLFERDPSLRELFQSDMSAQRHQLLQVLTVAVNGLDRFQSIEPQVKALGRRHGGYGVTLEHYQTVAQALIATLESCLGAAFTPAVRGAWVYVYSILSSTMWRAQQATALPKAA